jgi:murein L,D-transpeptidase YafK
MKRPVLKLVLASTTVLVLLTSWFVKANQDKQWHAEPMAKGSIIRNNESAIIQQLMDELNTRLDDNPKDYEASLLKGLFYFKQGDFPKAVDELGRLTKRAPQFHLAHLVYGDLLMAQVGVVSDVGKSPVLKELDSKLNDQLTQLREEAQFRLQAYLSRQHDRLVPRQLLKLGRSVEKAILVEKSTHRLYIYQQQSAQVPPQKVNDYYVSTGRMEGDKNIEGDLRTPEGVYFVTTWIPDSKLPDKYGIGAFPVNYPNEWDRRQGKTGDGIWLHGTESRFYSRPPLDSEGCVVLTNIDLRFIQHEIIPGVTPVIIAERLNWVDYNTWHKQQQTLLAAIEDWREDWESLDVNRYLQNYARDFWTKGYNFVTWSQRKKRIALNKTFQKINISDLSLFAYPEAGKANPDMAVARFHQQYRSNNFQSDADKRLYLKREQGNWRILYEGG